LRNIGNVKKDSQVRVVASGTLTNGTPVVINTDGTVSVAAQSGIAELLGSAAVFNSGGSQVMVSTYDSNTQRVVIAYQDQGNSNYGTAVVGTVSGTSLSFGTPVVFESATTSNIGIDYDSNAQKVVIAYRDGGNSNSGTAIVGTVSGTSISFGSAAVYRGSLCTYNSVAYDSDSQKVVIAYTDDANSDYGTAVVGTVSGTSISFGSATVFESDETLYNKIVYDSNAQKIVIVYRDKNNTLRGTAAVGTVSGTSISFGTPVVFEEGYITDPSITYDSTAQKVVIAYKANLNSNYGTAIVGTVSGTSISFGSSEVFESASTSNISAAYDVSNNKTVIAYTDEGNSSYGTYVVGTVSDTSISFDTPAIIEGATTSYFAAVYDSNEQRVVIAYKDGGNSNYGTAKVLRVGSTSTNLTSENYIGMSMGAFADGESAVINTANTIDRNQSGLTAGQTYFVQIDGTLGTTAADPSVTAGTAISTTELIVKG